MNGDVYDWRTILEMGVYNWRTILKRGVYDWRTILHLIYFSDLGFDHNHKCDRLGDNLGMRKLPGDGHGHFFGSA